jgi:hypothetical protein
MNTQIPAPVLRSPHHLLAAIPFLLGFRPDASVVVVWIHSGAIALTQRVDWPSQIAGSELDSWSESVVHAARHVNAQGAVLLGYPSRQAQAESAANAQPLLALCRSMAAHHCEVLDAMVVTEDGWQPIDPESGDHAGEVLPFDLQVTAEVSDDFMFSGWSFAESREEVCAEFSGAQQSPAITIDELEQLAVSAQALDGAALEQWRDEVIQRLLQGLEAGMLADFGSDLAIGLQDIRVRDSVLWHLAHDLDPATGLLALRALVRNLPAGYRAPAATVASICAWLVGDGVRASAALELAIHDAPDYGLAMLVSTALMNGLPPRTWQETMEQLTYEACRHGLS